MELRNEFWTHRRTRKTRDRTAKLDAAVRVRVRKSALKHPKTGRKAVRGRVTASGHASGYVSAS